MGQAAFQQIVGFKNLDELTKRIDMFSFRVLKKDCLDLPDKIYTARYVGMTKEQFDMYEQIRRHAMVLLDSGEMSTAPGCDHVRCFGSSRSCPGHSQD